MRAEKRHTSRSRLSHVGCLKNYLLACSALLALTDAAQAQNARLPRNDYGSVGLIDMPSARMAPDGELSFGASYTKNIQHYNFAVQALPWLEGDLRYSGLAHFNALYPVYWDRSFAFKVRLWNESAGVPAVAFGVNDLVGSGIYAGEYLVASKQVGPLDLTVGMGWGRLSSSQSFKNPLIAISKSFQERGGPSPIAGGILFNQYFHGANVGIFGGATWNTPIEDLALIFEYSSDRYSQEAQFGTFKPRTQLNIGLSYEAFQSATVNLDWLYGESFGASVSFHTDPTTDAFNQRIGPTIPQPHIRTLEQQRHALAVLLQNDPQSALISKITSGDKNALVDALWGMTPLPTDIALTGRNLIVKFDTGNIVELCQNVGSLISWHQANIDFVEIRLGRRQLRCAVAIPQPATAAHLNSGEFDRETSPHEIADKNVTIIDASRSLVQSSAVPIIKSDASKQGILINAISLTESEAIVYYGNARYLHETDAVNRLVRILLADAPPNVEKFRLLPVWGGIPQGEFDVLRAPTERSIEQTGNFHLFGEGNALTVAPMQNPVLEAVDHGSYPQFSWNIFPLFRQELFDPDNPLGVQVVAAAAAAIQFRPGLSLTGEIEANIYDNFSLGRRSNSLLPHVRSDWLDFFNKGKNGIGQLEMDYIFRLAPDVFSMARVGYLESMYFGVGGEILWRPIDQRWAIGMDAFEVQERNFNRLFGLQKYRTFTGHVTLYYQTPWDGLYFKFRAGQYLAGDGGFTVQLTRRFSTGVEVGLFFTKTNVSAAQFGEGSFDKGIIIKIPLDWIAPINTQSVWDQVIRPVQRDGGQTLGNDAILYDHIRGTSKAEALLDPTLVPFAQ